MLSESFQVDTNKLVCQMCLLRVTRVDPLMTRFLSCYFQVDPFMTQIPLRPNLNPQKPVLGSCRVHGLCRILTPLPHARFLSSLYSATEQASLCCYNPLCVAASKSLYIFLKKFIYVLYFFFTQYLQWLTTKSF